MAGPATCEKWILESIDKLRLRKARPDLPRICHMVQRRHGIDYSEIEADLLTLCEEGKISREFYRGDMSYRNVATWKRSAVEVLVPDRPKVTPAPSAEPVNIPERPKVAERPRMLEHFLTRPSTTAKSKPVKTAPLMELKGRGRAISLGKMVKKALRFCTKMITPETSSTPITKYATLEDIQLFLKTQGKIDPRPSEITAFLRRKISSGNVIRRGNSYQLIDDSNSHLAGYSVADKAKSALHSKRKVEDSESDYDYHPAREGRGVRPSSTRKRRRAKNTIGTSDRRKRAKRNAGGRYATSEPAKQRPGKRETETQNSDVDVLESTDRSSDKCDYCLQSAVCGNSDDLLVCYVCGTKAHASCMDYTAKQATISKNGVWQCVDCKTCKMCHNSRKEGDLLICDSCDQGYHMKCHRPVVSQTPAGQWICAYCNVNKPSTQHCDKAAGTSRDVGNGPSEDEIMSDDEDEDDDESDSESASDTVQRDATADLDSVCGLPTPCDSPSTPEVNEVDVFGPVNHIDNNQHQGHHSGDRHASLLGCAKAAIMASSNNGTDYQQSVMLADSATAHAVTLSDTADWSIDDVSRFIIESGFPTEATHFREQEIDGKSLLLMKRNDVLTGLSMKLGPALKIHKRIHRLQMQCQESV